MKRLQLYAGYSSFIALCLLLVGCQTQVVNSSDTEQRSQQTIATQSTSDTIDNIYQAKPNEAVIYYKRNDNNYDGWGLHLWDGDSNTTNANELAAGTSWGAAHPASGVHPDLGAYFIVPMNRDDWIDFMFIVHKGDEKDLGGIDHLFNRAKVNSQILYTFQGVSKLYNQPHRVPPISIDGASAHWLDASTIAFNPGAVPTVKLFYSQNADIRTNAENKSIEGGTEVVLKRGQLSEELKTRFPHLADFKAWSLPSGFDAKAALKGQLVVATFNPDGSLEAATLVQKSAVLDAVFASAAAEVNLGAIVDQGSTRFSVWAPTAQNITLKLYKKPSSKAKALAMSFDQDSGVWIYDSKKNLSGYFYRYDIRVYHPESNQIEQYEVTDPYSLSLSTNSKFSQVVDLDAENLKPARWGQGQYVVAQPEDIVIYESHLRDLTLSDQLGTATLNGKYGALAETDRASVQHLMALQQAGLTHLHLLPSFDIATTNEFAGEQVNIDDKVSRLCQLSGDFRQSEFGQYCETDLSIRDVLTGFPGDSDQQQNLMSFVRPLDNFNWGYDPFHYTVPEGSYAVNANGTDRILEYRDMVQSIHDMGLNFVMDVVYNHTNEAGLASKSVLDKVVPGYYHRLNIESGAVEN
ncbi:MAG: pullulanase, partial [Reinekea sp.]